MSRQLRILTLAFLLPLLPAGAEERSMGYVRTLAGGGTLVDDRNDRADLEENYPVAVGDRLLLATNGRADLVLPDLSILRLDGGSEVALVDLAGAPSSTSDQTLLEVVEGNLLLDVPASAFDRGGEPRIDTPNATIYVRREGRYRITSIAGDWTQVTVRSGLVEVRTPNGGSTVRAGEEAIVEGARWPQLQLREADREDALERWARELDRRLAYDDSRVDSTLHASAAPLRTHGAWVSVGGRSAWRPTVAVGWRPYHHGRWIYTRSGICWVTFEPWGWLTYHYGMWDFVPDWGWVWYPDRVFAPAWVYWYWGSDWVGWAPIGPYVRYYGHNYGWNLGFRWGYYGWVHDWYGFNNDWWCFSRGRDLHRRDLSARSVVGISLRDHGDSRGLLVTDTRGFTRDTWDRPDVRLRRLAEDPVVARLPDVGSFVARKPLPREVEDVVIRPGERGGDDRLRTLPGSTEPIELPKPLPTWDDRPRGGGIGVDLRDGRDRAEPQPAPADGSWRTIGERPSEGDRRTPGPVETQPAPGEDDRWRGRVREVERPRGEPGDGGRVSRSQPDDRGSEQPKPQPVDKPRPVGTPRPVDKPSPPPAPPPDRDDDSGSDWRTAGRRAVSDDVTVDWRGTRDSSGASPAPRNRTLPDEDWRRAGTRDRYRYPTIEIGPTPTPRETAAPREGARTSEPPVVRRIIDGLRTSPRTESPRSPERPSTPVTVSPPPSAGSRTPSVAPRPSSPPPTSSGGGSSSRSGGTSSGGSHGGSKPVSEKPSGGGHRHAG